MIALRMLVFFLVLVAFAAAANSAVVGTDWTSATTTTAQGTLGGVTIDVTGAGSPGYAALILDYDLSGSDYAPYQLAADQECRTTASTRTGPHPSTRPSRICCCTASSGVAPTTARRIRRPSG